MQYALIIIGIVLIVLNVRAIKNDKNSFKNMLNSAEDNMAEFDVKIGEARREFSETILELQKEIEGLKNYIKENAKVSMDRIENNIMEVEDEDEEENLALLSKELYKKDVFEHSKVNLNEENIKSSREESVKAEDNKKITEKVEEKAKIEDNINNSNNKDDNNGAYKVSEIEKMLKQGLSLDDISLKLGIGKGEVLLIKELYLK